MKAEDVMKALECCRYGGRCGECPCFEEPNCQALANDAAIALLREKDAEIESLREMNDALESGFDTVKDYVAQTMRRRLKESAFGDCIVKGEKHWVISDKNIDKIIKGEK